MAKADRAALERTVTALARLERLPTSAGEREAARWIARELGELGCRSRRRPCTGPSRAPSGC